MPPVTLVEKKPDGIYVCYFTGDYGTSLGMFTLKGRSVVGADVGGGVYKGTLDRSADGRYLEGVITIRQDESGMTITGVSSDLPVAYETPLRLIYPLESVPFHTIQTKAGPVNVRFVKMIELDNV